MTSSAPPRVPGRGPRRRSMAEASAQPTAGRHWLPVGLDWVTTLRPAWPQWLGIWRPADDGSAAEPTAWSSTS